MYAGIAGGLLVFTGIWHATEWMMDGRRRDTWALVPFGLVYLMLGCLIVASIGGTVAQAVGLLTAAFGGSIAFLRRDQMKIRRWVTRALILIDVIIVLCLAIAILV